MYRERNIDRARETERKAQDNAEKKFRDSSLPSRGRIEPGRASRGAPETNCTQLFGTIWHLLFSLQRHHYIVHLSRQKHHHLLEQ